MTYLKYFRDMRPICFTDNNKQCHYCRSRLQGWSVTNRQIVASKLADLYSAFSPTNDNELGTMFK